MTAEDLDDRMVEIISGEYAGIVGRAVATGEHGWIGVKLDDLDPEDDRWFYPVLPDEVIVREDLVDHGLKPGAPYGSLDETGNVTIRHPDGSPMSQDNIGSTIQEAMREKEEWDSLDEAGKDAWLDNLIRDK